MIIEVMSKIKSCYNRLVCLLLLPLVGVLLPGCNLIYDNLEDCPQGVILSFRGTNPCGDFVDITSVKHIQVQLYGADGVHIRDYNLPYSAVEGNGEIRLPVEKPGEYHFVVWGMADPVAYEHTERSSIRLQDVWKPVTRSHLPALFYGQKTLYVAPDRSRDGTHYDRLTMELHPRTQQFRLLCKGIPDAASVTLDMEDAHTAYDLEGAAQEDSPIFYRAGSLEGVEKDFASEFTVMQLQKRGNIPLTLKGGDGRVLFTANLVKIITDIERAHDITLNLFCLPLVEVTLEQTSMGVKITILDWNVVYQTVALS